MQIRIKDIKADAQDNKLSMRELKGGKKASCTSDGSTGQTGLLVENRKNAREEVQ